MRYLRFGILALFVGLFCAADAQTVTVQYLEGVMATDLSADGSVVVGNKMGNYETFRWTQETGIELLGMSSVEVLGVGAGGPKVSADGTRISATILGADSTYVTQGRWTLGERWQETMPPAPADGQLMDNAWGSAWGISGDGETVVGLYWRDDYTTGGAHASAWTEETGVIDLGSGGGNCRANAASYDGSVIVGWDENPDFGTWWPTVWRDGVRTVLAQPDWFCTATAVNDDGTVIGGTTVDPETTSRTGALWRWNGSSYDEYIIGVLDGTFPGGYGQAIVTEDPMVNVNDYLADHDVTLPAGATVVTLSGVSDDGSVMVGITQESTPPYNNNTIIITIENPTAAPDLAGGLILGAAYPNPFNPQTSIPVTLARDDFVRLEVFDAAGRRVRTLHQGQLTAGTHDFRWNGRDSRGQSVPSGVYLARMSDGAGHRVSRQMTLMK